MNKIFNFLKGKKYIYYLAGAVVLIVVGIFVFNDRKASNGTITVVRTDFLNQVSVSGKVETAEEADLGFAASGRIAKIYVKNNDSVKTGQILAQLDIADLLADLKIKEINSRTSDMELDDARENLEKVTTQENTKVESAYRNMLSEDLELIPDSSDYTATTPTISGIYDGAEGIYKISIDKKNTTLSDLTLHTFKLENTERIINEEGSTRLGTRGLYISFSDDLDSYKDTIWYLNIPNKSGSSYLANFNAYNEAKKARDLAIKNAEYEYQKLLTEDNDGVSSVAQAEIDKIRAEIKKNTISAPFDGIVTNIEKEVGEVASQNETIVTVMGEDTLEIESFVPEVSIAEVRIGQEAKVTLDAFGENMEFQARIVSIDPAETMRDGVSTYKVKMRFEMDYPTIRPGMTANVSIVIFEKSDVIVIPGGTVYMENGKWFVKIKEKNGIVPREVTIGNRTNLGQVEIVSGLEAGETVVLNPNAE
jgi:RND family efflux transporter MFP subunit